MSATMQELPTLAPAQPAGGKAGFDYFADQDGGLWGAKSGTPARFLAAPGKWRAAVREPAAPRQPTPEPATVAPMPAPVPAATCRRYSFAFRAELGGVVGELAVEASTLREVATALVEMQQHGIRPAEPLEPFTIFPDGTAWCAKHGATMAPREQQGDKWWSHNAGDEKSPCYCKGRPGKDSPGWDR